MKHIFVVVSPPSTKSPLAHQKWSKVNYALKSTLEQNEDAQMLCEGCVMINASSGMPLLAAAISVAEEQQLSYRVLFVENATEWKKDFTEA